MRVRKAVVLAAGYGTRLLPATKAQPKESLPLVDKPIIQYTIEEAVAAGLRQVIIVTAASKRAVEDHFDRSLELEMTLREKGDLSRALSRYNGTLGKPLYANSVLKALKVTWRYDGKLAAAFPGDFEPAASHFGKSLEIVSWIASAAASGSGARRIGLPTTM